MAEITYNSWLSTYKRPFGAALIGTNFEFDLIIDTPHHVAVNFVIQFENGFKSYEKMTPSSENRFHFLN